MEPKREVASVDIAALVHELRDLEGAHFDKAYLYPDRDLCRLKLRHYDLGRIELLGEVGDIKRFHRAAPERLPSAPNRPPNFAKMLRNRLAGGRVAAVNQIGFDRIVTMNVDVPDGRVRLVFELFGDGNLIVVGTDDSIVDCLREVRLRSRTVRPGVAYEQPSERLDPFDRDEDGLRTAMSRSDTDVVRTLATTLNLGGRYAEEICVRAGVDQGLPIEDTTEETYSDLVRALASIGEPIRSGTFEPRVYRDDAGVIDVSPFPLETLESFEAERYSTVSEAMDAYFVALVDRRTPGTDDVDAGDGERARLQRMATQQRQAIEAFEEQAKELREQAEHLYANYDVVDELLTEVGRARSAGVRWSEIADRLDEGATRDIPAAEIVREVDPATAQLTVELDGHRIVLDAGTDLEHNADRLYREAKEVEGKRAGAEDALLETQAAIETLDEPTADESTEEGGQTDWLSMSSVPVRRPDHWYERFRWFRSSDGFLVIGGRNAKQNEAIVDKYAEPVDRILHAQAHGGPVTVVKATAPDEPAREVSFPETTLEEAAQFAVSYSSVWKDGRFTGEVYMVRPEQMTKEAESGEYLATGAFAVRGEREYFGDVPVGISVGIACEPETRVLGGPEVPIDAQTVLSARLEPGRYAQSDVASRLYRRFRERFTDETFVRKVASPDLIQPFLPPGGSRIVDPD